jgi:hypothetical protein
MAMLIKRQARRASDLLQPAFFVFAPQRSPENRRATSVSQVGQTTQWSSSGTGSNTLIAIVLSGPIGRLGIIPRALRPDPERTLVASHRMARIDVHQTLRIATANGSIGREARLRGSPEEGLECAPKPPFHRLHETALTALRDVPAPGRNGRDPTRDARTARRPEWPVILSGYPAVGLPGVSGRRKSPRWRSAWRRRDPASLGCG